MVFEPEFKIKNGTIEVNNGTERKDYTEQIVSIREKQDMLGFSTTRQDTQLIANIINVLANEGNMTISRAQRILTDAEKILYHIGTI